MRWKWKLGAHVERGAAQLGPHFFGRNLVTLGLIHMANLSRYRLSVFMCGYK